MPKKAPVAAKGAKGRRATHHHHKSTESAKTRHQAALKAAKTRRRRKVSLGDVAHCPAEAIAMAARLAGWAVSDQDVLDLYARLADGPSSGFTIAAALTAGLPGVTIDFDLANFEEMAGRDSNPQTPIPGRSAGTRLLAHTAPDSNTAPGHLSFILGVDLPGPHAVTVAPDGTWWSWGKPFDPAEWSELVIEEAWTVSFR